MPGARRHARSPPPKKNSQKPLTQDRKKGKNQCFPKKASRTCPDSIEIGVSSCGNLDIVKTKTYPARQSRKAALMG